MTKIFNNTYQRNVIVIPSPQFGLRLEVLGKDNGSDELKMGYLPDVSIQCELQYVHYTIFVTADASSDMRNNTPVMRPYKTTFFKTFPTLSIE